MIANNIHSKYLQSVNNLSQRNLGLTGKNPSVACMIVDYSKSSEGQVLSYGLTSIGGSPHSEVNALNKIKKNKITNKTVMYVSLEPCMKESDCCAKRILKSGIGKVFISSLDPNPIIYKKGLNFLKKNNVKIKLAPNYLNNFKNINKIFYHYQRNTRPYVTLKLAISNNGFSKDYNEPNITSSETQYYMHKYRLTHDAIAVGYNTYIEDNPRLNSRLNGIDKNNFKFVISKKNKKLKKNFNTIKLNYKDEPKIFLQQIKFLIGLSRVAFCKSAFLISPSLNVPINFFLESIITRHLFPFFAIFCIAIFIEIFAREISNFLFLLFKIIKLF